jgi:hypothetical protein
VEYNQENEAMNLAAQPDCMSRDDVCWWPVALLVLEHPSVQPWVTYYKKRLGHLTKSDSNI